MPPVLLERLQPAVLHLPLLRPGAALLQLARLLDEYGAEALRQALTQALERGTPRASSVAFLLRKRGRSAQPPLDLSRSPRLAALQVRPHDPEDYDELCRPDDPDSE